MALVLEHFLTERLRVLAACAGLEFCIRCASLARRHIPHFLYFTESSHRGLFLLCIVPFAVQKFLVCSPFVCVRFYCLCFWGHIQSSLLRLMSRRFSSIFIYSFLVSGLRVKSLSNLCFLLKITFSWVFCSSIWILGFFFLFVKNFIGNFITIALNL